MKKEEKYGFVLGCWYKSKYNNYFKFEKTENSWNYYSERIIDGRWAVMDWPVAAGSDWGFLEDLTEIQPFLPPNHSDLFINKPIQNENLDYLIDLLKSNNIT